MNMSTHWPYQSKIAGSSPVINMLMELRVHAIASMFTYICETEIANG